MDVAFVTNVVYPFVTGGAQKRVHEIGRRLADRGHDVTVYGRHYWDGPPETTHAGMRLRACGPARELYTGDGGRRSITEALSFATRLLPALGRHVDEHDVVVTSVFPYFPVLAGKLATALDDVPLVTTWHEVWGDHWEDYLGRLSPFGKAVEHAVAETPQHPIAVSETTASQLADLALSTGDVRTVPNGIDYDAVRAAEPADDGFDVLFVGRLIEAKRVDRLLEAVAALDRDATLGVVGDGPEREALEARAAEAGVADRVTFLGFLPEYDDVLAQLRAADVFVSPSTREGFGITLLEAMAADCAVIAADHPDSAAGEVVGDAGFLVDPTVDALSAAVERALAGARPDGDPTARAREFDWAAVTDRAAAAYRDARRGDW